MKTVVPGSSKLLQQHVEAAAVPRFVEFAGDNSDDFVHDETGVHRTRKVHLTGH